MSEGDILGGITLLTGRSGLPSMTLYEEETHSQSFVGSSPMENYLAAEQRHERFLIIQEAEEDSLVLQSESNMG